MSRETKLIVDQLIDDLENRSSDFLCGQHTILDKKTNIDYWISNGWTYAGIYRPYEMRFGIYQGWRFHKALKKWKAANMIAASVAQ